MAFQEGNGSWLGPPQSPASRAASSCSDTDGALGQPSVRSHGAGGGSVKEGQGPPLPAIIVAVEKGDYAGVLTALENGDSIHTVDGPAFRNTPLHLAAWNGWLDICQLLITRGADVSAVDAHKFTPLHIAALWGQHEVVQLLCDSGAKVDAKNQDGMTPLHLACERGNSKAVRILISCGASVDARDKKNGFTPLHHASSNSCHEAAILLLEHGADPHAQSKGCLCWCHKTPIVLSKTPRMKAILQEAEQVALSPDAQKKDTTAAKGKSYRTALNQRNTASRRDASSPQLAAVDEVDDDGNEETDTAAGGIEAQGDEGSSVRGGATPSKGSRPSAHNRGTAESYSGSEARGGLLEAWSGLVWEEACSVLQTDTETNDEWSGDEDGSDDGRAGKLPGRRRTGPRGGTGDAAAARGQKGAASGRGAGNGDAGAALGRTPSLLRMVSATLVSFGSSVPASAAARTADGGPAGDAGRTGTSGRHYNAATSAEDGAVGTPPRRGIWYYLGGGGGGGEAKKRASSKRTTPSDTGGGDGVGVGDVRLTDGKEQREPAAPAVGVDAGDSGRAAGSSGAAGTGGGGIGAGGGVNSNSSRAHAAAAAAKKEPFS